VQLSPEQFQKWLTENDPKRTIFRPVNLFLGETHVSYDGENTDYDGYLYDYNSVSVTFYTNQGQLSRRFTFLDMSHYGRSHKYHSITEFTTRRVEYSHPILNSVIQSTELIGLEFVSDSLWRYHRLESFHRQLFSGFPNFFLENPNSSKLEETAYDHFSGPMWQPLFREQQRSISFPNKKIVLYARTPEGQLDLIEPEKHLNCPGSLGEAKIITPRRRVTFE
jgi:hypothetical protein